ncbi:MAG: hypothetical protein ACI840_002331 [Ulvibacter sp.]|jgi:hypothetical protein
METQTASVKKIALPYGLLLSLTTIVISVIVYALGMTYDQPWWQSLLNFVAMIGFIVYGIKAYKHDNESYLSLGEALKTGLAIALVAGLIGAVFSYLFVTVIEPDFAVNMLEATRVKMINNNPEMTQEAMDMALGVTEKMMSPSILVAFSIVGSLFIGFIISLITGLVMKNNRPE